jgi:hypothetical protein
LLIFMTHCIIKSISPPLIGVKPSGRIFAEHSQKVPVFVRVAPQRQQALWLTKWIASPGKEHWARNDGRVDHLDNPLCESPALVVTFS